MDVLRRTAREAATALEAAFRGVKTIRARLAAQSAYKYRSSSEYHAARVGELEGTTDSSLL